MPDLIENQGIRELIFK